MTVLHTDLDDDLGVLVREFERVVEDLKVLLQRDSGARQLLLVSVDVVAQLGRTIEEDQTTIVLEGNASFKCTLTSGFYNLIIMERCPEMFNFKPTNWSSNDCFRRK